MTEDEMVRWHHRLNGHECEQASGVSEGQGSLACCSPWGHKASDITERLNWTEYTAWSCISLFNCIDSVFPSKLLKTLSYIHHLYSLPYKLPFELQSHLFNWWIGHTLWAAQWAISNSVHHKLSHDSCHLPKMVLLGATSHTEAVWKSY